MIDMCGRCGLETALAYSCEHTKGKNLCKECYQELHWLMTNEHSVGSSMTME